MRKNLVVIAFMLLAVSVVACATLQSQPETPASTGPQEAYVLQETQPATVIASGKVRSNQSARLAWQSSGTIERVNAAAGDRVASGHELASLAPVSLPPNIILAEANLVSAKKALDDLQNSKLQQAQALKAVEDAQIALDELQNPQKNLAQTQQAMAEAQKAIEQAHLQVYILTTSPSQSVIDQTHANMLLAENKVNNSQADLERMQRQLKKVPPSFRGRIEKLIQNLEIQLIRDQRSYDRAVEKYDNLFKPPNATDLAVAQANLEATQARLAQAERDYDRQIGGPTPAEIATAEARLANARREWERLKDGPRPEDIAAAQARVAAAEAALKQIQITAPFDGVVTQVGSQPGDQVSAGTPAFRLDDLSRLLVDVQVSEIDINPIQAGQPAKVTLDAIPGKAYSGTVIEVAPVGTQSVGVVYFNVTVELIDHDAAIRPGMTAAIEISLGPAEHRSGQP